MNALIRKLVEAWGPSGYEHQVRRLIQEEVTGLVDDMRVDALGNLICRVGNGGKRVMVSAHMDEIGVMALFAEPQSGYLRFEPIGGLLNSSLAGNRVRFENGATGVIGVHDSFGRGRTSVPALSDFYIDVSDGNGGAVPAGSPAGFWREFETRGTRIIAKSLDDRIGCVVAIETLRKLNRQAPNEVHFVFSVQEEVGVRGAGPAAYGIDPDLGIALDVTATGDELRNRKMTVTLGGGAAIKVLDSGLVVPPAIVEWMERRASENGIAVQRELLSGGSTDARVIQITRAGVPSGCISIPTRFLHTTSETADIRDVQACIDLLHALLSGPIELQG
ncbi:MAG: M20/M25/M40 family metallo-hydrolase [Anaerolineaceae bacterium]|nr:M20/M25/M40 family metallo-hydrolase [Anaerolineaceae bacterium]